VTLVSVFDLWEGASRSQPSYNFTKGAIANYLVPADVGNERYGVIA